MPRFISALLVSIFLAGAALAADQPGVIERFRITDTSQPGGAAVGVTVPPAARAAATLDPTFAERRRALTREIQEIYLKYLQTRDFQSWDNGRMQILSMRDPAAAEPIARIVGGGDEPNRKLACEALGQLPGDEASLLLAKFVLTDESEDVYLAAVAALKLRNDRAALQPLTNALNGSQKARDRAAFALGEIGDIAAAPALIGHLKVRETKVLKAPAPAGGGSGDIGAYMFVGTIVTYIADVTPVVAEAAVGWDPTIGAIPVGAVLSVKNPRVTIHRTIVEYVPQPVVRDALKKITGEDFEYKSAEWRAVVDPALRGAPAPGR